MSESARSFSKGWIVVGGGHFEFYWEKKMLPRNGGIRLNRINGISREISHNP